ncbi:MAG TPA: hypothetical protein PKW17_10245 [Smithellaceae bacterium]|nr:hypothetical protein [Smithellaceae bacterium]
MNNYNAVPAALQDARLTLRDIAQDIIARKQLENNLALAESNQDITRMQTQAGIQRDEQAHELDLRRLAMQEQQNINRNNLLKLQQRALAEKIRAENEVISAEEFAQRYGARSLLSLTGIDPAEKRTAAQWQPLGQQFVRMLQQSPYLAATAATYQLKSDMDDILTKIKTPGISPENRATLVKELQPKYNLYQRTTALIKQATAPTRAQLAKDWSKSADLQLTYPDQNDYIEKTLAAHHAIHADETRIRTELATMDIDPDYMGKMTQWQTTIAGMADKAKSKEILKSIRDLNNAGDLKGAYDLAQAWAGKIGTPAAATTPATITTPPAASTTINDIPAAGAERLKKVGQTAKSIGKAIATPAKWFNEKMENRAQEQTAAAQKEIEALKKNDKLTPAALEKIQHKYPYARIK